MYDGYQVLRFENNYKSKDLSKMISIDDYFLRNKIIYKLGVK